MVPWPPPLSKCVNICPDVEYINHAGFNHCQPAHSVLGIHSMILNSGDEDGLLRALTTLGDDLEVCQDVFPCWDRIPA